MNQTVSGKELAAKLSVHPKTLQKWARCGIIPSIKVTKRCTRFDLLKCKEILDRRTKLLIGALILLSFGVDQTTTKRQHFSSFSEPARFVIGWSSVQSRQSAPFCNTLFSSIKNALSGFFMWVRLGTLRSA